MAIILVTGSRWQLGSEFRHLAMYHEQHEFYFPDLDITDRVRVLELAAQLKPGVIINCAAYTSVDRAEDEPERAMAVNRDGVAILVEACELNDTFLIHYSTDYVFNGTNYRPYVETDSVDPIGVYGKSKSEGEMVILRSDISAVVIRTSWVYSVFGNNFVKTIMRLGRERDYLNVVFDQIGTPTNARDLAQTTMHIIEQRQILEGKQDVFHYSNEGVTSWYDFALAIFELSKIQCHTHPILSADFPTKAKRPQYSVLDKSKIKATFQLTIPNWRESLEGVVKALCFDKLKSTDEPA